MGRSRNDCKERLNAANEELAMMVSCLKVRKNSASLRREHLKSAISGFYLLFRSAGGATVGAPAAAGAAPRRRRARGDPTHVRDQLQTRPVAAHRGRRPARHRRRRPQQLPVSSSPGLHPFLFLFLLGYYLFYVMVNYERTRINNFKINAI